MCHLICTCNGYLMCATGNPPLYIHTCIHVHGSVSLGTQAHDVPKVARFTVNVYGVYINKAPKDYIMLIYIVRSGGL